MCKDECWIYALANKVKHALNVKMKHKKGTSPSISVSARIIRLMIPIADIICSCKKFSDLVEDIVRPFVDYENINYYKHPVLNYKDFIREEDDIPKAVIKHLDNNRINDYGQQFNFNAKYLLVTKIGD